jgi:tripartite-type tricarboxylate transporter receptor subunit TctC
MLAVASSARGAEPASAYPSKPVTLIVTMAPGGTTDIVGRQLAQKLQENLGNGFVVDNKPGAGGNIGSQLVAKTAPDGYTLMVQLSSTQVINPSLYKNTGFDPVKDFAPITPIVNVPYVLVVHPNSPIRTMKDLIGAAKSSPKPMQYSSAGNGTPNHLLVEMLGSMTGVKFEHIPYKGAAIATNAVAAGEVPFTIAAVPTALGQIKGGLVRPLGISSVAPLNAVPDVPPIANTVPGFSGDAWVGLFAPAGTPQPIVDKLNAEVRKIASHPEFKDKLAGQGATTFTTTPAEFATIIKADLAKWSVIVKTSGAAVD